MHPRHLSTLPRLALALTLCAAGCSTERDRGPSGGGWIDEPTDPAGEEPYDPSGEEPFDPTDPTGEEPLDPGPGEPSGSGQVDPALVGIWGETWRSGTEVTNTVTGEAFTVSSGMSAQLKVRADGRYELEHASGGYSPTCASVSVTDRSTGYADFRDGQLVLRPTERTLEVHACDEHGTRTLPNTPLVFQARVSPYQTSSDEPSLQVELSGGPYPLTLKRLDPLPPLRAPERALPPGFQLGAVTGYQDMFGTWAPRDADLSFFDPATGTANFFRDNQAENRMFRFSPGQYELASYVMHTGGAIGGHCKRDVIYYERGAARFNLLVRVNDDVEGDVQFEGQTATLVVRIRDCGADDGTTTYTLEPGTSWARWAFHARVGFQLGCIYPRSPMQFAACTNRAGFTTYSPR